MYTVDIDQLVRAVKYRRRHVKVVYLTTATDVTSLQSMLLQTLQTLRVQVKHVLFIVPWSVSQSVSQSVISMHCGAQSICSMYDSARELSQCSTAVLTLL